MNLKVESGPYQLLPPLSAEEYAALKADIAARGVQVPVEVDEAGETLNGPPSARHRRRAGDRLPAGRALLHDRGSEARATYSS